MNSLIQSRVIRSLAPAVISLLLLFAARTAVATEIPIELNWQDLVPDGNGGSSPFGVVEHGQLTTPVPEDSATVVTNRYDGKTVRIPGYIVPLDYEGTGTSVFLLVPYFGACIHVPPPPANQLVLVSTAKPYELKGLFEAVYVTGVFGTAATSTQLAEVGYALSADKIEPYR